LPLAALLVVHAACVASAVIIMAAREGPYPGWRVVGPSGTHWFAFVGSWGFGALISWVWLLVGSGRADAAFQMRIALLLAIAFCAMSAWSGVQIAALRRMSLRWRGATICWRDGNQDREEEFGNFESLRRSIGGAFYIRFADQVVLKLDSHARNTTEFLVRISEEIGRDVY